MAGDDDDDDDDEVAGPWWVAYTQHTRSIESFPKFVAVVQFLTNFL